MEPTKNVKYHSITKVFQNGLDSCLLACIESFWADLDIIITQKEMIEKLIPEGICNAKGMVFQNKDKEAILSFGLKIQDVDYHFPINKKYEDNSLFIFVNYNNILPPDGHKPGLHVVRYNRHINDTEIIIMDPVGRHGLRLWNEQDLKKVFKYFYHIRPDEEFKERYLLTKTA